MIKPYNTRLIKHIVNTSLCIIFVVCFSACGDSSTSHQPVPQVMKVIIEKTHQTIQGQHEFISIYLDSIDNFENTIGSYDLLIQYDNSAISLTTALPGDAIIDGGWEYFTYRYGANSNCGSAPCPSGIVRIIAIAEYNNDNHNPDILIGQNVQLLILDFLVSDDQTLECTYIPIRFTWYDCSDNTLSTLNNDSLFISRHVYDYDWIRIDDLGTTYPSLFGANSSCNNTIDDTILSTIRLIDFQNGGIDIACADSIDGRGDINLNEIEYEISDAVLFTNYFIYGLSVFDVDEEKQIRATDANGDWLTLTVADLVYLIRVIIGDALPYPHEFTQEPTYRSANYRHTAEGIISISDGTIMGAAYVVLEGNVTPTLLADNMDIVFNFDGVNTRALIYSHEGASFSGEFMATNGANVHSIEMGTRAGDMVTLTLVP